MSKLSKFIGVAKVVEIRGEKLNIYSLCVEDMALLDRLMEISKDENKIISAEEQKEISDIGTKLIIKSFKDENFTEEEIKAMDFDLYLEVYGAVMDNLSQLKDGKGINRIKQLKEQAVQQQSATN